MQGQRPSDVAPIGDWSRLLDGRVAVVTGGGDGIGGAISALFAAHGALVEVAEVDGERAERTVRAIRTSGGTVRGHVVDVTRIPDVERLADAVLSHHGRIDVLVNNVGDYRPSVRFDRSTPESWASMYDINLFHLFATTRAFLGAMTQRRRGSIVNIHSVEGMRGFPPDPVYAAMKAAAAHFTTSLAVAVGRNGIRVNGIGPDLTQSPQVDYLAGPDPSGTADDPGTAGLAAGADDTGDDDPWASWAPVGRLGWPEDQARVALFLASDLSGYVTGHTIPVDGGTLAGGRWFYSPRARRFVNRPPGL